MLDILRAALSQNAAASLAWGGLLIGVWFGFTVQRTNFCAMGSISDLISFGNGTRFRGWVLAAATALAGAQILQWAGVVNLSQSMYLSPNLDWLGSIAGGLMFGIGMVLAGGCASRNLVRAGGGDLRALTVLIVMGISAYISIGGLLGPLRANLSSATSVNLKTQAIPSQSIAAILAHFTDISSQAAQQSVTLTILAAALIFCFSSARFRASPKQMIAGFSIGLAVIAGWALSGLAFDEMAISPVPALSLTFVRPTGDSLDWLQRYTAIPIPNFGVTSVFGTLFGGFFGAFTAGKFQLATFQDTADTLRNFLGAVLMGIGGVVGLGCTIGQGVTGVSTLAIGSYMVFAAIFAGGVVGVKAVEHLA